MNPDIRAPVTVAITKEQEVTDGLAVGAHGNAKVNAGNNNALPAKDKGKGRCRGRQ